MGETLSDKHKLSLLEDASPRIVHEEDECKKENCLSHNNNGGHDKHHLGANTEETDFDGQFSDGQVMHKGHLHNRETSGMGLEDEDEDDESYDSEDILEKGPNAEAMAMRDSTGLIDPLSESLVNMGENNMRDNIKEIRRMNKEIVDPKVLDKSQKEKDLLPKIPI